jgi:hypothetical protein
MVGEAWLAQTPGRLDKPGDLAQSGDRIHQRVHCFARGDVDGRDAHLVSGIRHHFRRRFRILAAHICQQHMLPDPNPARDSLTDLTRSDDDSDVIHRVTELLWAN